MELNGPVARFDAEIQAHTHARCERCGAVADVALPYDRELDGKASVKGWRVSGHELMFTGICPACAGE